MADRRAWQPEEDKAIVDLVKKYGTKRWAVVARKMVQQYDLKGRTGKQCRERWHNHLDSKISKMPWTQAQEKIIFQKHKKYGNKWTQIAQYLEGRTDNSIKNHFYSTLRRSLRRMNKLLGFRNSTAIMRQIKPSVLTKIFAYSEKKIQDYPDQKQQIIKCRILADLLLQFANQKPTKALQQILLEQNRRKFEQVLQDINYFNESYKITKPEKTKKSRNKGKSDDDQMEEEESSAQVKEQYSSINKQSMSIEEKVKEAPLRVTRNKLKNISIKKIDEVKQQKNNVKQQKNYSQTHIFKKSEKQSESSKNIPKQTKIIQKQMNLQNNKQKSLKQLDRIIKFEKQYSSNAQDFDLDNQMFHSMPNQLKDQLILDVGLDGNLFDLNSITPMNFGCLYSPQPITPVSLLLSRDYVHFSYNPPTSQQIQKRFNQIQRNITNNSIQKGEIGKSMNLEFKQNNQKI